MYFINKAIKYIAFEYGVISIFETISLLHNALKVLSKKPHRKAFKAPFYRLLKAHLTKAPPINKRRYFKHFLFKYFLKSFFDDLAKALFKALFKALATCSTPYAF
ncbi:hypothetical protein EAJ29_05210 [Campylobacter upsaliensis]|nr:hypothetical protein [Campylobacter upsaliensis]